MDEILNLIDSVSEGFPSYFFIYGIHLHLEKTNRDSEPYLMLTYISRFTALRKKSVSALKAVSQ